jgi:hypothetical protein
VDSVWRRGDGVNLILSECDVEVGVKHPQNPFKIIRDNITSPVFLHCKASPKSHASTLQIRCAGHNIGGNGWRCYIAGTALPMSTSITDGLLTVITWTGQQSYDRVLPK